MKAVERDRFLIGFLFAMIIHVVIVLLLGFVDLGADDSLQRTLPPVTVRLELPELPDMPELSDMLPDKPEDLPPEEIPEPETPEPEVPAEKLPAAQSDTTTQPIAQTRPETTTDSRAAASSSSSSGGAASLGPSFEIPQPSGERMTEVEGEEGRRLSSSRSSDVTGGSRSFEAIETRPVGSSGTGGQFSESRVEAEAIERSENPSDFGDTATTSNAGTTGKQSGSGGESVVSKKLLSELENRDSASGQGTAGSDDRDGRTSGETSFRDTPKEVSSDSGNVVYSTEGQTRSLLEYSLPDLTEKQRSELSGMIEMTVTFALEENGVVSSTGILKSSGFPEIDNKILAAVRNWKFTPVDGAESVEGQATIVIRAR